VKRKEGSQGTGRKWKGQGMVREGCAPPKKNLPRTPLSAIVVAGRQGVAKVQTPLPRFVVEPVVRQIHDRSAKSRQQIEVVAFGVLGGVA